MQNESNIDSDPKYVSGKVHTQFLEPEIKDAEEILYKNWSIQKLIFLAFRLNLLDLVTPRGHSFHVLINSCPY